MFALLFPVVFFILIFYVLLYSGIINLDFASNSRRVRRIQEQAYTRFTHVMARYSTFRMIRSGPSFIVESRIPFACFWKELQTFEKQEEADQFLRDILDAWHIWISDPEIRNALIRKHRVGDKF